MLPIRIKACSESDLRMLGNLARNIQRVLPVTQADIDAAAALGKGWVVWKVIEVNDPIDNLRGGTQLVIKQNSITPGQNVRRVLIVSGPGGETVVIGPGPSPLLLPDAIADSLTYVKAFGGTKQGLPGGYTPLEYIEMTGTQYLDTGVSNYSNTNVLKIKINPSQITTTCFVTFQNPSASVNNLGLFLSISRWNFQYGDAARLTALASANTDVSLEVTNGSMKVNSVSQTGTPGTEFTISENILIGAAKNNTTVDSRMFQGKVYYFRWEDSNGNVLFNGVPAKDSNDVVGMYDTVSGRFLTNQGSGSITAGPAITPTPNAPIDIISNNGAIKFSLNEANYTADNVVLGYWLRNSDGQPEASSVNFYTNMMPVKPNVSYVCFGRNKITNAISGYNRIAWYDADGVWIRNSTYTQNQPGIDVAPSNAAFARFHCNINNTAVTQELVDSYNWVFQQGTAEVPYTPYSPTGFYTDGTVETIKDSLNNTATAEMLLKVDTYQDEQEILSGAITRNVGVLVLDGVTAGAKIGTAWNTTYKRGSFAVSDMKSTASGVPDAISTHFEYSSAVYGSPTVSGFCTNNGSVFICFLGLDNITSADTANAWLADQYNAGTPVIVIYPLATPTTESVTGQTLQVTDGDNILEITQASLSGLELEAKYEKVA